MSCADCALFPLLSSRLASEKPRKCFCRALRRLFSQSIGSELQLKHLAACYAVKSTPGRHRTQLFSPEASATDPRECSWHAPRLVETLRERPSDRFGRYVGVLARMATHVRKVEERPISGASGSCSSQQATEDFTPKMSRMGDNYSLLGSLHMVPSWRTESLPQGHDSSIEILLDDRQA